MQDYAKLFFYSDEDIEKGGFYTYCGRDDAPSETTDTVAFDPWVSLDYEQESGDEKRSLWVVTPNTGVIGRTRIVYDPTEEDPRATREDWLMSFEMDPEAIVVEGDSEGTLDSVGKLVSRYKGDDHKLSEAERKLLIGKVYGGQFLVKLGILGPNPWDCETNATIDLLADEEELNSYNVDPTPTGPIEVTVKIVTGSGDHFRVQEFDISLSVPNMFGGFHKPVNYPKYVGAPANSGHIPQGGASQYEDWTFVIDPIYGASRVSNVQPWGIG